MHKAFTFQSNLPDFLFEFNKKVLIVIIALFGSLFLSGQSICDYCLVSSDFEYDLIPGSTEIYLEDLSEISSLCYPGQVEWFADGVYLGAGTNIVYTLLNSSDVCKVTTYFSPNQQTCTDTICKTVDITLTDPCEACAVNQSFSFDTVTAANTIVLLDNTTLSGNCSVNSIEWFEVIGNDFSYIGYGNFITPVLSPDAIEICQILTYNTSDQGLCTSTICSAIDFPIPSPCDNCIVEHDFVTVTDPLGGIVLEDNSYLSPNCYAGTIEWYEVVNGDYIAIGTGSTINPSLTDPVTEICQVFNYYSSSQVFCSDTFCAEVIVPVIDPCDNCLQEQHFISVTDMSGNITLEDNSYLSENCFTEGIQWYAATNGAFVSIGGGNVITPTLSPGITEVCQVYYYFSSNQVLCSDTFCNEVVVPVTDPCLNCLDQYFISSTTDPAGAVGNIVLQDYSWLSPNCYAGTIEWFEVINGDYISIGTGSTISSALTNPVTEVCQVFNYYSSSQVLCADTFCMEIIVPVIDPCDNCLQEQHFISEIDPTNNGLVITDNSFLSSNCFTEGIQWYTVTNGAFVSIGGGSVINPTLSPGITEICQVYYYFSSNQVLCSDTFCNEVTVPVVDPCTNCLDQYFYSSSYPGGSPGNIILQDYSWLSPNCNAGTINWFEVINGDYISIGTGNFIIPLLSNPVAEICQVYEYYSSGQVLCADTFCMEVIVPVGDPCDNCLQEHFFVSDTSSANGVVLEDDSYLSNNCYPLSIEWYEVINGDYVPLGAGNVISPVLSSAVAEVCQVYEYYSFNGIVCADTFCNEVILPYSDPCEDCEVVQVFTADTNDPAGGVVLFDNSSISNSCNISSVEWFEVVNGNIIYMGSGNVFTAMPDPNVIEICQIISYVSQNQEICSTMMCQAFNYPAPVTCEDCVEYQSFSCDTSAANDIVLTDNTLLAESCYTYFIEWFEVVNGDYNYIGAGDTTITTILSSATEICQVYSYFTPDQTVCYDTLCKPICNDPVCDIEFDFIPFTSFSNNSLGFDIVNSIDTPCVSINYSWDFGNGISSSNPDPFFTNYNDLSTTYEICLTVQYVNPNCLYDFTNVICKYVNVAGITSNVPVDDTSFDPCSPSIELGSSVLSLETIQASGDIVTSGSVDFDNAVNLIAGNFIELKSGFSIEADQQINILTDNCSE